MIIEIETGKNKRHGKEEGTYETKFNFFERDDTIVEVRGRVGIRVSGVRGGASCVRPRCLGAHTRQWRPKCAEAAETNT